MDKYKNGKIYTIRSFQTDDIYVGSTIEKLCSRMSKHRYEYRKYLKNNNRGFYSSFEILQYKDAYIELLEEYPCNSKEELCKKEGEYIRSMDCVINKCMAGIYKTDKEYYEENKEKVLQQQKEYYENNKEKILEYHKEYYENNEEKIKEYQKEYSKNNKEKIKEYHKEYTSRPEIKEKRKKRDNIKINCACGSVVRKGEIRRHERSKKHLAYII